MKTKNKRITIAMVLICITYITFAQNTSYLKITFDNDGTNNNVSFPPETKFELRTMNNKVVYTDKDTTNSFLIVKKHKLTVYPKWKETTDIFHITKGKIERIDNRSFYYNTTSKKSQSKPDIYDKEKYPDGITLKKTLEVSKRNPNLYNATFEFSNGIVATYTDGKFKATLNNKDLFIEYKYFIYFDSGIVKLSFNPRNGETWWIFDKYE